MATTLPDIGSVYRLLVAEGAALKAHNSEQFVLLAPSAAGDGRSLRFDVTPGIIAGRLNLTLQGASSITLDIFDPDWQVEASGILDLDADRRLGKIDLELNGVWFRLAQATRQDPDVLRLVFEDLTIALLREHRKSLKAARGTITRAQFIEKMVDELPAPMRLFYSPERGARQPVEEPDFPDAKPAKGETGFPDGARFTINGATADAAQKREVATVLTVCDQLNASDLVRESIIVAGCGESGFVPTATSTAGAKGVFQLMPSWWSKIDWRETEKQARYFIEHGYYRYGSARQLATANPRMSPGEIASRVEGSATDGQNKAYYNSFLAEARKIIRLWRGGSSATSADTTFEVQAYEFSRGLPGHKENSWEAMTRLAEEVNWRVFVAGGVVVYVSDDWLISENKARLTIDSPKPDFLLDRPTYDWDQGKVAGNVELQVAAARWSQLPGTLVDLEHRSFGPIQGRWIVSEVDQDLFDADDCRISLIKPITPRPEPAADVVTVSGDEAGGRGSGTGSILYAGDSLGVGTTKYFRRIVRGHKFDTVVLGSMTSSWGADQVEGFLRSRRYDNIVFDFGTNDTKASQLRASIKRVRDVAPEAQIYLLTLNGPYDTPAKNKLLRGWSNPHVHVIDWHGYAARNGIQFDRIQGAPVHPLGTGFEKRAHLIAKGMGFE